MKILVVDDETDVVEFTSRYLTKRGYKVLGANSGIEALGLLAEDKDVGILITDLAMPNMNGLNLIKMVRILSPDIGIIVLTGYDSIETTIEAFESGVFKYLRKPMLLEEIVQEIQECE